jgi:hypothetical protein
MSLTMTGPRLLLPRFGTPRDESRESLGPLVGEVARRLGLPLMPWQQHVLDVALEVLPDGRFAYDEVDLTVPRQSGKTILLLAMMVHRCVMAQRMSRADGSKWARQRVTYTAQTRNAARKKLERDFADILRGSRSFHELTNPKARPSQVTQWKVSLNNGAEHMLFGRGNYLQIDAPSKTGGHGDTLDVGVIDEAFAHRDDAVEQSMRPAQATRWNPQLWVVSTAGDENSPYLYRKVKAGREACQMGAPTRVAYFEWSIPTDANIDDEGVWWDSHPALGFTISPDFLRAELERARRNQDEGGEDLWRRAYGNQWVRVPVLSSDQHVLPIPLEQWATLADHGMPTWHEPGVFGIDASPDRQWSSIAFAAHRSDGLAHVELVQHQAGVSWLADAVIKNRHAWGDPLVAVDTSSPAASVLAELEAAGVRVAKFGPAKLAQACGAFIDAVTDRALRHHDDLPFGPALLAARQRTVGDGWAWSRRDSTSDITAIVAATLAFGALPAAGTNEHTSSPVVDLGDY